MAENNTDSNSTNNSQSSETSQESSNNSSGNGTQQENEHRYTEEEVNKMSSSLWENIVRETENELHYDTSLVSETRYRKSVGFYYDSQLKDPYLSITLHPNTVENPDNDAVAKKAPGPYLERTTSIPTDVTDEDWDCYSVYPLVRALITDDFSYSINNNFSDFSGGNPIENIFNSLKPYAGILGKFGKGAKKARESMKGTNNYGSTIAEWGDRILGWVEGLAENGSKVLNQALMVQGTRFTYYNGTQFNVNNLELKYVKFSDWTEKISETGTTTYEFIPVTDYIKSLNWYVMGKYHPVATDFFKNLLGNDMGKMLDDQIKEYVGLQSPPAGFSMSCKNLNNMLKGTLRLNIGGRYALANLVIKNMNVNLSKVQAKDPRTGHEGETVPLYAEIVIQLAPASMMIDTTLNSILENGLSKSEILPRVAANYKTEMEKLKKNLGLNTSKL